MLGHWKSKFVAAQGYQAVSRNTFRDILREVRRHQEAVADEEDVLCRALGEEAVLGQEEGLVVALLQGFCLGQRGIHIFPAHLAAGGDLVVADATPGGEADPEASGGVYAVPEQVCADGENGVQRFPHSCRSECLPR